MAVKIPVSKINIQLNTNISESAPILFNRGMIKLPKMDEAPNVNSELPYFTKFVRYPRSIQSQPWKTRIEFFFNREVFVKTLRNELSATGKSLLTSSASKSERESVEKRNIMIMLRSLFPIPEKYGIALKNSYDHLLRNKTNNRIVSDVSLTQALNVFGLMYRIGALTKEREEYFLTLNGKEYDVEDLVWENDIVNHPLYLKFLTLRRKVQDRLDETKDDVNEKCGNYEIYLNNMLSVSYALDAVKKEVVDKISNGGISGSYRGNAPELINDKFKNKSEADIKNEFYTNPGKPYTNKNALLGKTQNESEYQRKVDEYAPKIKRQDTIQSLIWNMKINVPNNDNPSGSDAEKVRDRVATRKRVEAQLDGLVSGELKGDDAARILVAVKNDLDEHESSRGERSTTFINGDYAKYFDLLLKFAVQVRAAAIVKDFVEKHTPMNLTDKKLTDGSDETPIVKRVNAFIKANFATQAKLNNDQIDSVSTVYEPARKTHNKDLYNLLTKIRTGADPPSITNPLLVKNLDDIYEQYASMDATSFPDPALEDYLYIGVEEVQKLGAKDTGDMESQGSQLEIYVWMNLVDAKKMDTVPKAACKLYDKMLEQELREITDLRHRDKLLTRYRNLDFDSVIENPAKVEEPPKDEPKKTGGYTRRKHKASRKITARI